MLNCCMTRFSIEYWFRCMDLDGDGVLSMYELQYFYEDQCQKLDNMAIEPLPFEDCLCQMLDLVKPKCEGDGFYRMSIPNTFFSEIIPIISLLCSVMLPWLNFQVYHMLGSNSS